MSLGHRASACIVCQRRKVKCDRNVPCANCLKSQAQCIPAHQYAQRRKRRFPERELLQRLREYKSLLRQSNVRFVPLHSDYTNGHYTALQVLPSQPASGIEDCGESSPDVVKSESPYDASDIWQAINQVPHSPDSDDSEATPHMDENLVKKAWDQAYGNIDPIFSACQTAVDLIFLYPELCQIFQLWQIYLDNVDPLLKVTHTPTLQAQIVDAVSHLDNINPDLEALMFSIYCMGISSLASEECETRLGLPKQALLARYQSACQQALVNYGFLRSDDRNCLLAYFLYLISLRPFMDPRSLSPMLGVAVRVAQRMGIHSEASCSQHTLFEAEMRRRLWWSLVLFDTRIGEMAADHKSTTLAPLWDAKPPANVNDIDLRPDMKTSPAAQAPVTESLFVVTRSEIADVVRRSSFYLDFTYPILKSVVTSLQQPLIQTHSTGHNELKPNPLHFTATWMARGYLAKFLLMEHHAKNASTDHKNHQEPEATSDATILLAIRRLQCDTTLLSSPLTHGYRWLLDFHLPFPAYVHIFQTLTRRPSCQRAEEAWDVLSSNLAVRSPALQAASGPIFGTFTKLALQAWGACEVAFLQRGETPTVPDIVRAVKEWLAGTTDGPLHSPDLSALFGAVPLDLTQQDFLSDFPMVNVTF
ncbi:hypothetical protein BDW74DRAFT_184808 [Aspergillus multicolor]|uniref:Zn(II)2Cys6 transcription factor n=1 Tax=Aspergillus multicolor TaxID=41759 RepID=UPI003CCCBEF8